MSKVGRRTSISTVESADTEVNEALYRRIRVGDTTAMNEMIERNVGLVARNVERFVTYFPDYKYLIDDLTSEGLLDLTRVAKQYLRGADVQNVTAYLSQSIQTALGKFVQQETTELAMSNMTRNRKKDQALPKRQALELQDEEDEETSLPPGLIYDPRPLQKLEEAIEAACETNMEREMVAFAKTYQPKKCPIQDIAEHLGIPVTTAYMMRKELYARFLKIAELRE